MRGPPDEIETHAQGGTNILPDGTRTNTAPFERWRYRYIEGLGSNVILEFVDTARDGSYRLQFDPSAKEIETAPAVRP